MFPNPIITTVVRYFSRTVCLLCRKPTLACRVSLCVSGWAFLRLVGFASPRTSRTLAFHLFALHHVEAITANICIASVACTLNAGRRIPPTFEWQISKSWGGNSREKLPSMTALRLPVVYS